jgi:hypothetical protein
MRADLAQQFVTQVRFDFAISIHTLHGAVIRVQNDFLVSQPDLEPLFVAIDDLDMAARPMMRLFGQVLDWAEANDDGSLALLFTSGTRIDVAPGTIDEPWSISTPSGELLVGLPGGGSTVYTTDAHA